MRCRASVNDRARIAIVTVRRYALFGVLALGCGDGSGMASDAVTSATTVATDHDEPDGDTGMNGSPEPDLPPPAPLCVPPAATLTFVEGSERTCVGELCFTHASIESSPNLGRERILTADLDDDGEDELIVRGKIWGEACTAYDALIVWSKDDDEWVLRDAVEIVGQSPLYTVDANEDGVLDVAAGLDYVLGVGDGTLGDRPANSNHDHGVNHVVDLGDRGVHLLGIYGGHSHGSDPYGTFWEPYAYSDQGPYEKSLREVGEGWPTPLGPNGALFGDDSTNGCSWGLVPRAEEAPTDEPLFTFDVDSCGVHARVDFDDDGIFDIALGLSDDTVVGIFVDEDGAVVVGDTLFEVDFDMYALHPADVDGDGRTDLVAIGKQTQWGPTRIQIALAIDGGFDLAPESPTIGATFDVHVDDLDGDGRADLWWHDERLEVMLAR